MGFFGSFGKKAEQPAKKKTLEKPPAIEFPSQDEYFEMQDTPLDLGEKINKLREEVEPFAKPDIQETVKEKITVPKPEPKNLPAIPMLPNIPKTILKNTKKKEQPIPYFSEVGTNAPNTIIISELSPLPVIDIETPAYTNYPTKDFQRPNFIRTDYYGEILSNIETMKSHIQESTKTIESLENLKRNAEVEHGTFKDLLEDIQRKLIYVDRILFEK